MPAAPPTVVVLAGANGAGKTTSARTLLADTLRLMTFVNADVIAQGLSGFAPEHMALEAGHIMLRRLRELAAQRQDFAFETTLAGRTHAAWLKSLRFDGYHFHLVYFWLDSSDLAVARVAERVARGGHSIPEETIRRRYARSLYNLFQLYLPLANQWQVFDNSASKRPTLVAEGNELESEVVHIPRVWMKIRKGGGQ